MSDLASRCVQEIEGAPAPRAAELHAADYERSAYRVFRVRPLLRRKAVLDYGGLPRAGEAHPTEEGLVCHALIPQRRGEGWHVCCLYRPVGGERRAA